MAPIARPLMLPVRELDVLRCRLRRRWWILIGVSATAIAGVASVEITSTSSFCNSCHIMGSFYDSWKLDTHADVGCVECHIPPGVNNFFMAKLNGLGQVVDDWLNRTSMKPSASVSDFACTRSECHVIGQLDSLDDDDQRFLFRHETHFERDYLGIAIGCTTCHSHVKGENHFSVNTNTCIVCHLGASGQHANRPMQVTFTPEREDKSQTTIALLPGRTSADETKPPTNCDTCHTPPSEPFEHDKLTIDHAEFLAQGAKCDSCHYGVTADRPIIDDENCYSCHVFGMEEWTSTIEMHTAHTMGEHKVECFECHGVIKHGGEYQASAMNDFECRSCHSDQHSIQRNTYANGGGTLKYAVETRAVSPMVMTHVGCPACHIEPRPVSSNPSTGATVANAVPEACDRCHQQGFGAKMIPLWQRTTRELYNQTIALLPVLHPSDDHSNDGARRMIESARQLLELVRLDGSWGVHNPIVTQQLIEQARDRILQARAASDDEVDLVTKDDEEDEDESP